MKKRLIVIGIVTIALSMFGSCTQPEPPTTKIEPTTVEVVELVKSEAVETEIIEPVFNLTDEERSIVECMVMGECGYEPYDGQVLVAQCILNACIKEDLQPSEIRVKYKYAGWHEEPTDEVKEVVSAVFDCGEKVTTEPILYFYAPKYSKGSWHETQVFVMSVGGHKFFKGHEDWS